MGIGAKPSGGLLRGIGGVFLGTFFKLFETLKKIGFFNVLTIIFIFLLILPTIKETRATGDYLPILGEIGFQLVLGETQAEKHLSQLSLQETRWGIFYTMVLLIGSFWLFFKVLRILQLYLKKVTGGLVQEGLPSWAIVVPIMFILELIGILVGASLGHQNIHFTKEVDGETKISVEPIPFQGFVSLFKHKGEIVDSTTYLFEPLTRFTKDDQKKVLFTNTSEEQ